MNLTYRKSRYVALKNKLDSEYKNTFTEIDVKKIKKNRTEMNFIDLFAGCGGLSLGLEQSGFNKLCDVEILSHAYETLKINFPKSKHYNGDITKFKTRDFIDNKEVHLVVGGPHVRAFRLRAKEKSMIVEIIYSINL